MESGTSTARLDPGAGERFVPLRRQLGVSTFGINQIILEPGERGRIHRHRAQEEVYIVLEGRLTLGVEGEEQTLEAGEVIRVAPDVRRQLVNRHRERLVLIALGGAREHEGRDGEAFTGWEAADWAPPQEVPMPPDLDPSELHD
jgi:quercetin dioxygenase-like cupin family protein